VSLDFPLFLDGQASKVTKEVFHGYQLPIRTATVAMARMQRAANSRPIYGTHSQPG
jgi:hypothetical protein